MVQNEIEDVFDNLCRSNIYQRFHYPLYLSGLMDKVETEILENFLEQYNLDAEKPLLFDEFTYHFSIFEAVLNRNDLPIKYL
ncbi:hypothetical protein IM538_20090 [Cytobacillus suaedae]|nr:hypothetical protein IM538_20090 [Cytobacillus suaedae]